MAIAGAPSNVAVDNNAIKDATAAVWALSANDMMDDDVDLIDSDELLDDIDLKKPDPASLRGCRKLSNNPTM